MCARMFPAREEDLYPKTPKAERRVYQALKRLPNDYVVFHSVEWAKRNIYTKHFSFFENDFLVLHPRYGLLVIEVKGGKISFAEDGYMHQTNMSTGEEKILKNGNDPLSQANRGIMDCFLPFIEDEIQNFREISDIKPCIWFPMMERLKIGELPILYETSKGGLLFGDALDSPEQSIRSVYKFYFSDQKVGLSQEQFKKIQRIIAPVFDMIPSASYAKHDLEEAFLRLTNEQVSLLDYLDEQKSATIQGAAGTGKTVVAMEKARRLAGEGRKPLYLCFNRMLADYLGSLQSMNGVKVVNISRLIFEEAKKLKIFMDGSKQEWEYLYDIGFADLDYTDVVIDEAQDFDQEEIEYFKDFTKNKDGSFFVFFDKHQLVQKDTLPEWITESECRLVLSKNCRNTVEIAKTSFSVIDFDIKAKLSGVSGAKPRLVIAKENPFSQLKSLIDWYTGVQNKYALDDIAILSLKSQKDSILNETTSIFGIPVSAEKKTGSVLFTTAKKFKGLEAKCVIVIDIDEKAFVDPETKRVFYVACSRAMHRLSLFIVGDDEKIREIADSIAGPKFAPVGKIKNKTQTETIA